MAWAILFHSHLPKEFWGEAILTATHTWLINCLRNCCIGSLLLKFLMGIAPNYENLRVFGCLCFITNLDIAKKKFDVRALKRVCVGYAHAQKVVTPDIAYTFNWFLRLFIQSNLYQSSTIRGNTHKAVTWLNGWFVAMKEKGKCWPKY